MSLNNLLQEFFDPLYPSPNQPTSATELSPTHNRTTPEKSTASSSTSTAIISTTTTTGGADAIGTTLTAELIVAPNIKTEPEGNVETTPTLPLTTPIKTEDSAGTSPIKTKDSTTTGPIGTSPTLPLTTPIKTEDLVNATNLVSDSSPRKKKKDKKKKKNKRRSKSDQTTPTTTKGAAPSAGHLSNDQIASGISEIDSFLQSLKMGTYPDMIQPVTTMEPVQTKPADTSKPLQASGTAAQPRAKAAATAAMSSMMASKPAEGVSRSMGLSLISQMVSSSDSSGGSSEEDSDEDSSSSDSSEEEEVVMVAIEEGPESDEEQTREKNFTYPMIKDEVKYQELPPLDKCNIPFPEGGELLELGVVSHITEQLVVIQSLPDTPPVDEGTVLWSVAKESISVVFDIFGPVKSPYYSVHVHSTSHAHSLGLSPGKSVYVIPGNKELTKYVFTQQLLQQRGSDASWKGDSEVPEELRDYSDDETERQHKKAPTAGKKRATPHTHQQPHPQHTTPFHQPHPQNKASYSSDPKMQAYFPGAATSTGRGIQGGSDFLFQHPVAPPAPPPPSQRGVPYFTPRGFVGYLPPGSYQMVPYPPPQAQAQARAPPPYATPPYYMRPQPHHLNYLPPQQSPPTFPPTFPPPHN